MADNSFDDEGRIRALIVRAGYIADEGEVARYKEIYTADAIWELDDRQQVGVDAIIAAAVERRAGGIGGPGSFTRHFAVPVDVRFIAPDEAVSVTYSTYLTSTDTNPTVSLVFTYTDHLLRETEGWRITRRNVSRG